MSPAGQGGLREEQPSFVLREVQEGGQGQAAPPHLPSRGICEEALVASPKSAPKSLLPFQQEVRWATCE